MCQDAKNSTKKGNGEIDVAHTHRHTQRQTDTIQHERPSIHFRQVDDEFIYYHVSVSATCRSVGARSLEFINFDLADG